MTKDRGYASHQRLYVPETIELGWPHGKTTAKVSGSRDRYSPHILPVLCTTTSVFGYETHGSAAARPRPARAFQNEHSRRIPQCQLHRLPVESYLSYVVLKDRCGVGSACARGQNGRGHTWLLSQNRILARGQQRERQAENARIPWGTRPARTSTGVTSFRRHLQNRTETGVSGTGEPGVRRRPGLDAPSPTMTSLRRICRRRQSRRPGDV